MADRHAGAAVVRARAAARSAVGCRSSAPIAARRRCGWICGSSIAPCTGACCSCRRRCATARVLRTLLLLDLESHPPSAGDRHRHDRDRSGAGARDPVLAAGAGAAVGGNAGDADGPTRRARRRDALRIAGLLDTHRPDGFEMRGFELTARLRPGRPSPSLAGPTTSARRRLRAPASSPPIGRFRPVLRRFRPPVAVRVTVERGRPVRLAIDRRGMPGGADRSQRRPLANVGRLVDRRRGRWDRDEWDVALRTARSAGCSARRETGTWFLEGV